MSAGAICVTLSKDTLAAAPIGSAPNASNASRMVLALPIASTAGRWRISPALAWVSIICLWDLAWSCCNKLIAASASSGASGINSPVIGSVLPASPERMRSISFWRLVTSIPGITPPNWIAPRLRGSVILWVNGTSASYCLVRASSRVWASVGVTGVNDSSGLVTTSSGLVIGSTICQELFTRYAVCPVLGLRAVWFGFTHWLSTRNTTSPVWGL